MLSSSPKGDVLTVTPCPTEAAEGYRLFRRKGTNRGMFGRFRCRSKSCDVHGAENRRDQAAHIVGEMGAESGYVATVDEGVEWDRLRKRISRRNADVPESVRGVKVPAPEGRLRVFTTEPLGPSEVVPDLGEELLDALESVPNDGRRCGGIGGVTLRTPTQATGTWELTPYASAKSRVRLYADVAEAGYRVTDINDEALPEELADGFWVALPPEGTPQWQTFAAVAGLYVATPFEEHEPPLQMYEAEEVA